MGKALRDATMYKVRPRIKRPNILPLTNQTKNPCTPLYSALNTKTTYHLLISFLISIPGLAREKASSKVKPGLSNMTDHPTVLEW